MTLPPAFKVAAYTMRMLSASTRSRSPYSYHSAGYDFLGGTWEGRLVLTHADQAGSAAIAAFLSTLNGAAGTFQMPPPDNPGAAGITQNPTAFAAANANATTLRVALASDEALTVGNYLTIGAALHIVNAAPAPVADVQTLTIWPRLHAAVAPDATINALAPTVRWSLAASRVEWSRAQDGARAQTLDLIEAL